MKDLTQTQPARRAIRHSRSALFAIALAIGTALIGQAVAPIEALYRDSEAAVIDIVAGQLNMEDGGRPGEPAQPDRRDRPTRLGEEDGVVPDGVLLSVFDDETPAVANLDPELLDALRRAAIDAADDGVVFYVTSGWRSPAYQEQLLREAVAEYGSEAEAARWVATPETSAHVSGDAADLGPSDATEWLSRHGAGYGLCQIYVNEPWHYELRLEAITSGCPPMYDDPTHDPRMQP